MVSRKGDSWVMTGTTKDEDLKDAIEDELESDPDLRESDLVAEAVRERVMGAGDG
jgi:hypothetical protein